VRVKLFVILAVIVAAFAFPSELKAEESRRAVCSAKIFIGRAFLEKSRWLIGVS
jgi:hypothetical protein